MADYRPIIISAGLLRQLSDSDTLIVNTIDVNSAPITSTLIGRWNTAFGWGDHAGLYDAAGTAAAGDAAHLAAYNHANYNTAYGWGDHDGLYDAAGAAAAGDAAHLSAYDHTGFFFALAGPTADNQVLQATGSGAASWTKTIQTIDSIVVDNLTLNGNAITASGDIDLTASGDINLAASGSVAIPSTTELVTDSGEAVNVQGIYSWEGSSSHSGTMKIRLGYNKTNVMPNMKIVGYNYASDFEGPWELMFGGYDTTTAWVAQGCCVLGNAPFQSVRVAYDGTAMCLLLGLDGKKADGTDDPDETATGWNYPWIEVREITAPDNFGSGDIEGTSGWDVDFSTNEFSDWTITLEEDCPMWIGPGVGVSDNGDGTVLLEVNGLNVAAGLTIGGEDVPHITGGDIDLYVSTTGADTNNGEISTPFLTVARAILELYRLIPTGTDPDEDYTITIHIEAGHYTLTSPLKPTYSYGASVTFEGEIQDCSASTASSYTADTAFSPAIAGMSYITVSGILTTGTTATIGDHLVIMEATGGTNPHLVEGSHEITAWNSGTRAFTVTVARRSGVAAVPSGTITLSDAYVAKTKLTFTTGNGMYIFGAYHGGTWDKMVMAGNTSGNGVWCINGGKVILGNAFSTSKWSVNIYAQNQGMIFADGSCHSFSNLVLVKAQNGGVINIRNVTAVREGTVLTGAKTFGIQCFIGATISSYKCRMSAAGGTAAILCYQGAFVESALSQINDPHATCPYGTAFMGGGIDFDGGSQSNGAASTLGSPTTNGYIRHTDGTMIT